MITIKNLKYKIVVGMATINSRISTIKSVIDSIYKQDISVDEFIIYNNDINEYDATDNAKFYYFETEQFKQDQLDYDDIIFFSIDDDIIYPTNYISKTIENIFKYNCIITYHGRILKEINDNYYKSNHLYYPITKDLLEDVEIDVLGTGVTAFKVSYFKPTIFYNENKRMSDLILSLQIITEKKRIVCCEHKYDFIEALTIDLQNSCYYKELHNITQSQIANEIYKIKNNPLEQLHVYILHYNREKFLQHQIEQCEKYNINYTILDDGSDFIDNYKNKNIIKFEHQGKDEFYKKWQYIFDDVKSLNYKYVMVIPDDFYNIDYQRIINLIPVIKTSECYKLVRDSRTNCWTGLYTEKYNTEWNIDYFIDCQLLCNRNTFLNFGRISEPLDTILSSGVGKYYSSSLITNNIKCYSPLNSYAYHNDHPSMMHYNERKNIPLISLFIDEDYENNIKENYKGCW